VGPRWIDAASLAEHLDGAAGIGTSKEDNVAAWDNGEVELPLCGKGFARSANRLVSESEVLTVSVNEALAAGTDLKKGPKIKSVPDLALPQTVEVFDGGLEAGLPRRREDWSNAQLQAQSNNPTERS
jgi:hypothetical protein